jgi:hypothetical protein
MLTFHGMLFLWFAFALIVAIAAGVRNRNPIGWFLLAAVLSPLVAGLALIAVGRGALSRGQILRTLRQCPACAEFVQREARICKHCRSELPPAPAIPTAPAFDWRLPAELQEDAPIGGSRQ